MTLNQLAALCLAGAAASAIFGNLTAFFVFMGGAYLFAEIK